MRRDADLTPAPTVPEMQREPTSNRLRRVTEFAIIEGEQLRAPRIPVPKSCGCADAVRERHRVLDIDLSHRARRGSAGRKCSSGVRLPVRNTSIDWSAVALDDENSTPSSGPT